MKLDKVVKGVTETMNPKKGNGSVESIVILVIVVSVIVMNFMSIKIDPIVASSFGLVAGYLFGNNSKGE